MPQLDDATTETLGNRAYRELKDQILDGTLAPGQRLSLRRVAGSLGMSMAPVGVALRELSRDGLVESEPGWGTRVRRLDADALRNQHILRTAVECEAARHACRLATDEQLAQLQALAEELDARIDHQAEPDRIHRLDSRFHLRIAELSGSRSLVEVLETNQLVRLLAHGSKLAHNVQKPQRQHVQLVEAIGSRDPDTAASAMREHCVRSMELQLSRMATGT